MYPFCVYWSSSGTAIEDTFARQALLIRWNKLNHLFRFFSCIEIGGYGQGWGNQGSYGYGQSYGGYGGGYDNYGGPGGYDYYGGYGGYPGYAEYSYGNYGKYHNNQNHNSHYKSNNYQQNHH